MDSIITAAARALAAGDPLGALNRVSLRDDPPALALRGIAMAQLGDLGKARELVRRAARAFGSKEPLARARCIVAEAEIALAARDLKWPAKSLDAARATLEEHGDRANAAHAHYLAVRRLLLIGKLDAAERMLGKLDPARVPPAAQAVHHLAVAGIAMRRWQAKAAAESLGRAKRAAQLAGIPALSAEIDAAASALAAPAARLIANGTARKVTLAEIEMLLGSKILIVDAGRHVVRDGRTAVSLATRPVLFALARTLAEHWPGDAARETLLARAFRAKQADESHRARLRVEIGRLRRQLRPLAGVTATPAGFALEPGRARDIVVLAPPIDGEHAELMALLSDGESWSSSSLALALGTSQRNVQRALNALAAAERIRFFGRGRARRWLASPLPGIATGLLLPAPLPGG